MRKKDDSMRETLLKCAREIAETQGFDVLNIRVIARLAGISIGTVYNYFSDKDDILLALTEENWKKTLIEMQEVITSDSFYAQLEEMYSFLSNHIYNSAGILMQSLVNVKDMARNRMQSMQDILKEDIIKRITFDPDVSLNLWNEKFTKEQYAHFIIMNMMIHLQMRASDFDFFIEIVKRTIY